MRKKFLLTFLLLTAFCSTSFAYTRDWANTTPIDHTLNKNWPANDRNIKVDVSERLDDVMNGFTSGDTVTDFNRVPMKVRGSDDTGVADTIILYGKDVSSKTELHTIDEDDNVIQITTGGSINAAALSGTGLPSAWQDKVWPVGSIYISYVSTNPNTLLGFGTWTAFGAGKVLVGLDSGDTDFDTVGETGGSKTHTLTVDEMPSHTHTVGIHDANNGGAGANAQRGITTDSTLTSSSTGGGSAHNNVQPYITVYMWRRTS